MARRGVRQKRIVNLMHRGLLPRLLWQQLDPLRLGHNGGMAIPAQDLAYPTVEESRCSCLAFEKNDGAAAVIGIAIVIAVNQVRPNFPQVASVNRPFARHAEGLSAGRPAVHQHESHVAPPNAKQNTVSEERRRFGGGAQR